MRPNLSYKTTLFIALLCAVCTSCVDEPLFTLANGQVSEFTIVGDPVQAYLDIAVSGITVDTATRAEEPVADYDGEDTEEERHVDDLWVFEYDASTKNLIYMPQHITINDQSELANVPVTLSDNYGKNVVIYVVANSGSGVEEDSKEWVVYNSNTESYDGFMTISDLEKTAIPTPHPQRMTWDATTEQYVLDTQDANAVSIPMSGYIENVRVREGADILVPVSRMFAKVLVRVDLSDFNSDAYTSVWLNSVTIGNIPEYSTVGALGTSTTTTPANYSACPRWIQRSFEAIDETTDGSGNAIYPYLIYLPENIQGENGTDADKGKNIPSSIRSSYETDALSVIAGIYVITTAGSTQGEYTSFIAYPGGNATTNFNVRRNCLYRVTLKINDLIDDVLPSANCIICLSGETTAFFPYCREDTGGGYEFTDYLDAYDDTGEKVISYVKIIWQSTDGGNTVDYSSTATGYIGDNSKNEYVWIDDVGNGDAIDEYHRRIHVTIPNGHIGNALIGAYNSSDEIIWSWHIWSRTRATDPTTVNTKLYYTYDWDNSGIYGKDSGHPRVAGYTIMNCNLGAMQDEPSGSIYATSGSGNGATGFANALPTFGTLYQWGRKDPFPPIRVQLAESNYGGSGTVITDYDNTRVGNYYDNENKVVTIVGTNTPTALFYSVPGTEHESFDIMMPLSIKNPTVFYAGTNSVNMKSTSNIGGSNGASSSVLTNYYPEPYDGNWFYDSDSEHYNRLWGGYDPEHDQDKISKTYNTGLTCALGSIHMYDDYGEKSIFDPCPYGWRVSPPDLWLGFTATGLNPNSGMDDVNYNTDTDVSNFSGLTMYMTEWKEGATSFFPCQGTRSPDGCAFRPGQCGNYANATSDDGDRVNILHIHQSSSLFKIFENGIIPYYLKSTASAVRCVRINSVQQ